MGLVNDIKRSAARNGTKIQSSEAAKLEKILNRLFFLPHDIEGETAFVRHVMTRGEETQERRGLHASNVLVGDNKYCVRAMVLSLAYKQTQGEEVSADLKKIFEEGNAIHEKWQRLFIRGGYGTYKDMDSTHFCEEYQLYYSPDAIVTIPEFYEEPMVCEIKSVNTFQFKKMVKHPSAWKQCQFYMHMRKLKRGFVLNEDKNTQEIKLEVYDYDPALLAPYEERLDEVAYRYRRMVDDKKLCKRPEKAVSPDCKFCENCVMKDACWNIGMGRVLL